MKTALLDFPCPTELIAQTPAARRDESRLLVVHRATRALEHRKFRDIASYLRNGDCLVRNTARVLPARLFGRRLGGGRVECFLLRPHENGGGSRWWCLLRPGKKLQPGATFAATGEFAARVLEKSALAEYLVEFAPQRAGESVAALAERIGHMPLPPYIRRHDHADAPAGLTGGGAPGAAAALAALDRERYQTVFADPARTVAAAAPTAGLHFTDALLERVRALGVSLADVVLHVGPGTFRPIETDDVADHPIHREHIEIPAATRTRLATTPPGRRIAVGTTTVRTLEHYARDPGATGPLDAPYLGEAGLFIFPPFEFRLVDALITNFHLPRSTLLCLVAAFLTPGSVDGIEWLRAIYAEAVRERYRFFSYGDGMLIL